MNIGQKVGCAALLAASMIHTALAGRVPVIDASQLIDRQAPVQRHNPRLRDIDPSSPFTLGNGRFAFTADITGLQSLSALSSDGVRVKGPDPFALPVGLGRSGAVG